MYRVKIGLLSDYIVAKPSFLGKAGRPASVLAIFSNSDIMVL
jgi:hypothetical protein